MTDIYVAKAIASAERSARYVRLLDRFGFKVLSVQWQPEQNRFYASGPIRRLQGYVIRAELRR